MQLNVQAIGLRIKERRKELKLTQLDIRDQVGISSGNMSEIEQGKRLPAATTLIQLSKVLECSIDYILTGDSPITENTKISAVGESAQLLLSLFYKLSPNDQEELILIAQMKADRREKTGKKSENSGSDDLASETA